MTMASEPRKTKVSVCKDLFGAHSATEDPSLEYNSSPLKSIWGESSNSNSQLSSNSVLLSPALKRSPNRFSTSPKTPRNGSTQKKKSSTPKKLSKYSPFRKKIVYNVNPSNTIKKFFPVKEQNLNEVKNTPTTKHPLGIEKLYDSAPLVSQSTFIASQNSQTDVKSGHLNSTIEEMPKPSTSKSNITSYKSDNSFENNVQMNSNPNTPIKKDNLTKTPQSSKKLSPSSKITSSKDVYGSFLLRIILETMSANLDKDEQLLSEEEFQYINVFSHFDQPSQRLYGRLLNRKLDWIRTASMKYGDITLQLMLLEQNRFITTDCSNESLDTLLNLLTIPELKKLCKTYKLTEKGVKSDIITRLVSRAKQPSIKSFFSKTARDSAGEIHLRNHIYEQLGVVIKVEQGPRQAFLHCLLFFSYPHFRGLERDRFKDQLALVGELHNLTFPYYEVCRSTIFQSREHFLRYKTALLESSELLEAKEDKDWESALKKLREIEKKLESYLNNEERRFEAESLPGFLRRYTAGGCYVRAVSSSVDALRSRDPTLIESCLEMLLGQRLFYSHRRGQWYEQLALLHQINHKDNEKASQTVLRGLRDEYIDVISRHMLSTRAAMLEGRKKNGVKDYLKDALATQRGLVDTLDEAPSITITKQVLNSNRPGLKQVYVQDAEDGKLLSSVEEVAREHFRLQGYTQGGHDEGAIIKSLIFACFWDEIYGEVISEGHGVFHSEFQTVPLDWNSETFYERRREKLKSKLQDLAEGGIESVALTFQQCFANNFNKESVVNWKYFNHTEAIETLIKCIDIDVFLNLSRLLLRHHRVYGAGFPDLTLWNPEVKKCIFVEVKSPNDQLSMKQRVWLHSLNKMGATAVVCHVQSVGCKSQKRKVSSPVKDS